MTDLYNREELEEIVINDDGSKSYYFTHKTEEKNVYEVLLKGLTLEMMTELEREDEYAGIDFAIKSLNDEIERLEDEKIAKDFFEEISK